MKSLSSARGSVVLNTSFVLLAPDGKSKLSATGRSPRQAFRGTEEQTVDGLVAAIKVIAKRYPGNGKSLAKGPMPALVDVRRAFNVAACDNQPLVVVCVRTKAARTMIVERMGPLAWHTELRGRFAYATSASVKELAAITGTTNKDAVYVIQPGTFGLKGNVIASTTRRDAKALQDVMRLGLRAFVPASKSNRELRDGKAAGLTWDAESLEVRGGVRPEGSRDR